MDTDEHYFASKFSRFAQISCANAKGCFAICYRLLAIGYWLSAIGYWLSAIDYRPATLCPSVVESDRRALEIPSQPHGDEDRFPQVQLHFPPAVGLRRGAHVLVLDARNGAPAIVESPRRVCSQIESPKQVIRVP